MRHRQSTNEMQGAAVKTEQTICLKSRNDDDVDDDYDDDDEDDKIQQPQLIARSTLFKLEKVYPFCLRN